MRRPLRLLPPAEKAALQAEMGVDSDNFPLGLTPEERKAALNPGVLPPPLEKKMEPLISKRLAAIAGIAAFVLGLAADFTTAQVFIPPFVPFILWALAAVAALLAGVAVPAFKGGAVVPMKLAPAFLTASTLLFAAQTATTGWAHTLFGFGGLVAAALGGGAIPAPEKPSELKAA